MSELSAQDLRRLKTLEDRLEKAADEKRSFSVERRELRARAASAERAASAAEKRSGDLDDKLAALLAENARLATQLDELGADADRLRGAGVKLRDELDATKKSLRESVAEARRLTKTLQRAEKDRERLAEKLKLAEAQLKAKTTIPVLPAKEVAKLIEGFMEEVGSGLPGLSVREGEIHLQVAFGKVGRASGFVVPSADAPADVRKNLHDVSFRFERSFGAEPEG